MKVTVCELPDDRSAFEREWTRLTDHVRESASSLVVLPEMPFYRWFMSDRSFDAATWIAAVHAHDLWEHRCAQLAPAAALGSRPVDFGDSRYNEGVVWDVEHGVLSVHAKSHVPDELGDWQGSWYESATPDFAPVELPFARIGFLMGAELWAHEEARRYGEEGVQLLVTPRSGGAAAFEDWLEAGCAAARLAEAYELSSNRSGAFGGQGWIIAPDGEVLAVTNPSEPFVSADLELPSAARRRASGERVSPDALDPWETGVPPFP